MDYKVVWTEPAQSSLREIFDFLNEFNQDLAVDVRDDILRHFEILGLLPCLGPFYERDKRRGTRLIVCRDYRIFYRIREAEKAIDILIVWHSSRREPRLPS